MSRKKRAWMPVKEAADYCEVSVSYLAKLRSKGQGPAYTIMGRVAKYDAGSLDEWIGSKKVTPGKM